jgi:2-dehydropantoate 2-reductase
VNQALASLDGLPENAMSSMQRDIMAHRPSELESQNGAVVRLGREAGIETPVNTFLYDSLLPLEMRARGELLFPE